MNTFKTAVRFTVLSFVLGAGVFSIMGLDPASKGTSGDSVNSAQQTVLETTPAEAPIVSSPISTGPISSSPISSNKQDKPLKADLTTG